jgi:hypothetical protein
VTPQSTDRTMLYRSEDGERLEHARLRAGDAGGIADGTVIGVFEGRPIRVRYEITCDSRWHVRNVSVESIAIVRDLLSLSADEDGTWRRVDGGLLEEPIFRCADVAIALTPAPHALTIRRLALAEHQAAIVSVASIAIPSMTTRLIEHRYTCLELGADGSRYRFEDFDSGERSELQIDSDGVIAAYDKHFTRIWPAVTTAT